jgi:serine protease Do
MSVKGLPGRVVTVALNKRRLFRALRRASVVFGLAIAPVACTQLREHEPPPTPFAIRAAFAPLPSFAPVVDKVLPAVVSISARPKPAPAADEDAPADSGSGSELDFSPVERLLRHFFEQKLIPSSPEVRMLGSGFVIDAEGDIVTSNHAVADAEDVTVIFQDKTERPAKIVGRDSVTDLAVLKVAAIEPMARLAWGDSDAVRVGDWVLAIGNPFGLGGTVSAGIVSARGRDIHASPYDDFLQIDAAINRGNSGGPTFNLAGEVIGISTAIATTSGGSEGIAFAIPSKLARPIVEELLSHGKVRRGWLGLDLQEMTPQLARALGLRQVEGVLVADMDDEGPAAKAGFRQGDVVLSYNGTDIRTLRDLPRLSADGPIGRRAAVKIWRRSGQVTLSPVIEEMPAPGMAASARQRNHIDNEAEQPATLWGLKLAPLTPGRREWLEIPSRIKGVLVVAMAPDSPFARFDITVGDVIESIDQQPVTTPKKTAEALRAAMARNSGVALLLLDRGGTGRFVAFSKDSGMAARDRERP